MLQLCCLRGWVVDGKVAVAWTWIRGLSRVVGCLVGIVEARFGFDDDHFGVVDAVVVDAVVVVAVVVVAVVVIAVVDCDVEVEEEEDTFCLLFPFLDSYSNGVILQQLREGFHRRV